MPKGVEKILQSEFTNPKGRQMKSAAPDLVSISCCISATRNLQISEQVNVTIDKTIIWNTCFVFMLSIKCRQRTYNITLRENINVVFERDKHELFVLICKHTYTQHVYQCSLIAVSLYVSINL